MKAAIMLPTYNEAGNITKIVEAILGLESTVELKELGLEKFLIVIVDDNSPDGTGKVLDELAKSNPEIKVVHQAGKAGIGKAHKVGIAWAYHEGYEVLVTMDADLTHSPHDIPRLLEHSPHFSVVLGSRHLQKK